MSKDFFRNNGLTLCLLTLFGCSFLGQVVSGHLQHSDYLEQHRQPPQSFVNYLSKGEFIEATFENWESEFLQMGLYVLLTSFLYQKGSAESKDPDKPDHRTRVRDSRLVSRIYRNSLFLAFITLFLVSFFLHLLGSTRETCQDERLHGGKCPAIMSQLISSRFWFESFQNWQSEFLSVAALVVLSIFLRQEGSPESKDVFAPNSATGKE
jgi:hypothetical protein